MRRLTQQSAMPNPGENLALDAQTRAPVLVGISIAFLIASFISIAARLYTRYCLVGTSGLEDLLITLATAST